MIPKGVMDAAIQQSAYTLVMWEHQAGAPGCRMLQEFAWLDSPPKITLATLDHDDVFYTHHEITNFLWADGHAKAMHYGQLRRPMFSVRKDIYP